jgi:hypothetical protein
LQNNISKTASVSGLDFVVSLCVGRDFGIKLENKNPRTIHSEYLEKSATKQVDGNSQQTLKI